MVHSGAMNFERFDVKYAGFGQNGVGKKNSGCQHKRIKKAARPV